MPDEAIAEADSVHPESAQHSFAIANVLFLRAIGIIYAFACGSFATQVRGLIGSRGLLPAHDFLATAHLQRGSEAYHAIPTVFWWSSSDAMLVGICWAATLVGCLIALGIAQGPLLIIEWGLFLSITAVGQDFFAFQWDSLLVEAGFIAIFLAPWRLWSRWRDRESPPTVPLWLGRLLLFKLMVMSGLMKLLKHDPTWASLTALDYHFETQPLPTWIGFVAHQAPSWMHQLWTAGMFIIEIGMPAGIFFPRPGRLLSAASQAALMAGIGLTGNYCYFNLLTMALCLLLVDDAAFPARWRVHPVRKWSFPWLDPRQLLASVFAVFWIGISGRTAALVLGWQGDLPAKVARVADFLGPFRSINHYALFVHMTTRRNEITIEGSNDGQTWQDYSFPWKPGDPKRRPGFVEPLQPRLDWQMWFAALGSWRRAPWIFRLQEKLLEGSPEVLALLDHNPFPAAPPRYIRLRIQQYHFSSLDHWRNTGDWWTVAPEATWSRTLSREDLEASP